MNEPNFQVDAPTKNKVANMLTIFLGVLSLFVFVGIFVAIGGYNLARRSAPNLSTITVSGVGELSAKPDIAQISFTVSEKSPTAAEAQKKVTDKMAQVMQALKENGIAEKDIKTVNYVSNPVYEQIAVMYPCSVDNCPPYRAPKITGYEVSQFVEAKVRKAEDAGKVLGAIGALNVSQINNTTFVFDDEQKMKNDARDLAIKDARAQAERLAKGLGVTLGRIVSFQENGGYYPMPMLYSKADAGGIGGATPVPEVTPGENKTTATVSVTYEIY